MSESRHQENLITDQHTGEIMLLAAAAVVVIGAISVVGVGAAPQATAFWHQVAE